MSIPIVQGSLAVWPYHDSVFHVNHRSVFGGFITLALPSGRSLALFIALGEAGIYMIDDSHEL